MINMIAATSLHGIIGLRGDHELLWDVAVDLKLFHKRTEGQCLVMGHNTFKSLDGKLKRRKKIVLSRSETPGKRENNTIFYNSIGEIISNHPDFTVIGGEAIYRLFLPIADEIFLTTLNLLFKEEEAEFAYFPLDAMEREFYLVNQSEIITDRDTLSGYPVGVIFNQWNRQQESIH